MKFNIQVGGPLYSGGEWLLKLAETDALIVKE